MRHPTSSPATTTSPAVLWILAVLATLGLVALFWLRHEIATIRAGLGETPQMALDRLESLARLVFGSIGAVLAGCGLALLVVGARAWRQGRYPPAGSRLAGTTPAVHGRAARTRAALASALGLAALAGAWYLPARALRVVETAVTRTGRTGQPPLDWELRVPPVDDETPTPLEPEADPTAPEPQGS